ncbi:hypothetical protein ACFV6F_38980 [Kitasatospora phosalacinea]|uniref:hypothetical protein n=1 Tax=Kitasatospora phosalacinea TaxID=2065 RepID=UPI0036572E51
MSSTDTAAPLTKDESADSASVEALVAAVRDLRLELPVTTAYPDHCAPASPRSPRA